MRPQRREFLGLFYMSKSKLKDAQYCLRLRNDIKSTLQKGNEQEAVRKMMALLNQRICIVCKVWKTKNKVNFPYRKAICKDCRLQPNRGL